MPSGQTQMIDPTSYLTTAKTNALTFTEAKDKMVGLRKLVDGHKSLVD